MEESKPDELTRVVLNLPPNRTALTKSQRAYTDVRKAIVTHMLPAAIPLDEALLQSLFPVGRTPLREALKLLAHERFLSWPAHQAPSVSDVSLRDLRFLYETRMLIEPRIALLAAQRATDTNLREMEHLRDAMVGASANGSTYESVEYDYALHAAIAKSTQDRFLADASNQLNLQSLRIWYRAQASHGIHNIDVMHNELVNAIAGRNDQLALELARRHIENSLARQKSLLDEL